MTREGRKAWTISAVIHASTAILLFIAGLISGCSDSKADQYVLLMVTSENNSVSDSSELSEVVALPEVDADVFDVFLELSLMREPFESHAVASDNKREEVTTITYADFTKDNPFSKKSLKNDDYPQFGQITLTREEVMIVPKRDAGNVPGSEISNNEWDRYIASMNIIIRSNWNWSTDLYVNELCTIVQFTVSKNGTISNVQIVRSSGDSRFDATVRSAFNKTKYVGVLPAGESKDFTLRFEIKH